VRQRPPKTVARAFVLELERRRNVARQNLIDTAERILFVEGPLEAALDRMLVADVEWRERRVADVGLRRLALGWGPA